MTAKEKVLAKFPEAVCQRNKDNNRFEVKDGDKVLASSGTPRSAWSVAWNSLPAEDKKDEE